MITRESIRARFPVKPLSKVADFLDSRRKPVKEADRKPGPFPYYGANGQQGTIDEYLFDEPLILLAEDGGFFDAPDRGIAYRISGKTWVNNHAHVIRPKANMDLAFLARVLENYDALPFISGSTRAKLTKGQAEKIEIPVPPLDEQKRIAAILDQADELRRKRQRAFDRLNQLGQAIFHEMFGSPNEPRSNLPAAPLSHLVDCLDSQRRPVKAEDRKPGRVPYYGANGQQGWIDQALFDESLVLVAEDGGHFESRERGVAYRIDGPSWVNNHAHILRARKGVLTTEYLHRALRHFDFTRYISGSTRSKLTKTQLMQCEIAIPSYSDQVRFDERIMKLSELLTRFLLHQDRAEQLFASLQHRAFRGEL